MSEETQKPAWRTILVSLVLTVVLVAVAYYTWTYANSEVRQSDFTKNTLVTDLRFFVGLLAVFLVLSVLDRVINFVKSKIGGDH